MASTSGNLKNGQMLQASAGSAAIAQGDLLVIGGNGEEAYSVGTIDYAAIGAAATIQSGLLVAPSILPGSDRQPSARDILGNIYVASTNSVGDLIVNKFSPLGVLLGSAVIDSVTTSVNTAKLIPLTNGNFAVVYAQATGALVFAIFDAQLSIVVGATSIATEFASTNIVYHDAIPLSAGGFAVVFQSSAGTAINYATYSNAGASVVAATSVQTLGAAATIVYLSCAQLSTPGNIVIAYRSAVMTPTGARFLIVSLAGAPVAGPTAVDTAATLGLLSISVMTGFFAIVDDDGTTIKVGVYSNSGALQGGLFSATDSLHSLTSAQVKLVNDGTQFWLAYLGSVAGSGVTVVQIPTSGAGFVAVSGFGASVLNSNFAMDAALNNGLLVIFAASTGALGQYWMTIGLPDASLGITTQYQRTAPTLIGNAASTTGSSWPKIVGGRVAFNNGYITPNGDWTGIFLFDQASIAATILAIQKMEPSSIIGVMLGVAGGTGGSLTLGNAGTAISVNGGPGEYPTNRSTGSSGVPFNHVTATLAGAWGVLYPSSISMFDPSRGSAALAAALAAQGSTLKFPAGRFAINVNDVVAIGGPGNEAYSVNTIDYAKTPGTSTVLSQTALTTDTSATYTKARQPCLVDALGNIYVADVGAGAVLKYSSTGSLLGTGPAFAIGGTTQTVARMCFLSNGDIAVASIDSAGINTFVMDPGLSLVFKNPTQINIASAGSTFDMCALAGGGFVVAYQGAGANSVDIQIFTNLGAVALGATVVFTGASTSQGTIRIGQLTNGNILVANAQSSAGGDGGFFTVLSTSGVVVVAQTKMTGAVSMLNIDIAIAPAGSPAAGYFAVMAGNAAVGVYNNAGLLQGSLATVLTNADTTLSSSTRIVTDGIGFWAVGGTTLQVAWVPVAGASSAVSLTTALSVSGLSLDACIVDGMLAVFYASSATAQSVVIFGAPDAYLGISSPYIFVATQTIGSAAATTGTRWPCVRSTGDCTVIFVYDQQSSLNTFIAIYKLIATAIVGVSQTAVPANDPGAPVTVGAIAGTYATNPMGGTSGGVAFDHTSGTPVGAKGNLYNAGVTITTAA